jgi:peptide/nickel transport system permease protein
LARLDFGKSMWSGKPVVTEIATRFPISLEVALMATVIAVAIAIPLGTISALKQNSWIDLVVRTFSIAGLATPSFWLGIVSILIFAVTLQWFPSSDRGGLSHLVLPALTLGAFSLANTTRIARASMIESLSSEYTQTANAKGLRTARVVGVHALKNSGISILTLTAYMFSTLMGGALVTEVVFAWPGVGRLMVDGVLQRDFPVVQGAVFMVALVVVITYMLLDLAYTFLDPRLRRT